MVYEPSPSLGRGSYSSRIIIKVMHAGSSELMVQHTRSQTQIMKCNGEKRYRIAGIYYDAAMRIKIALVNLGLWFNRRLISRFTFLTCIEHKQASHFLVTTRLVGNWQRVTGRHHFQNSKY